MHWQEQALRYVRMGCGEPLRDVLRARPTVDLVILRLYVLNLAAAITDEKERRLREDIDENTEYDRIKRAEEEA